jgi:anti-sigma B factor antagonist
VCGSVPRTSPDRPSSWKVTEVADLRGNRLLVLHGELDIATTPELVAILNRLRRQGHAVELDLAAITFMDSTGLTALMDAHVEAASDGWAFSIRRTSPAVQRVFELAGMTRLVGE